MIKKIRNTSNKNPSRRKSSLNGLLTCYWKGTQSTFLNTVNKIESGHQIDFLQVTKKYHKSAILSIADKIKMVNKVVPAMQTSQVREK